MVTSSTHKIGCLAGRAAMFENLERWKGLGESERVRGAAGGLASPLAPASTHDRVRACTASGDALAMVGLPAQIL